MTDRGAVFDLGYKPHDGERLGTPGAFRATVKDGLRRVLGLRRKARKKILPFFLLGVALLPAVVFVGLAFFLGEFSPDVESPFGRVRHLGPVLRMSATPPHWSRPAVPLGSHPPAWPDTAS